VLSSLFNFILPHPSLVFHSSGQHEFRRRLLLAVGSSLQALPHQTTPPSAPSRPREALQPLHWFPSASHQLLDARRRLPLPPSSLLLSVAPNPKRVFLIDCTNTFPTTHWSSCACPSPMSAARASPSSLTPPPPLRALVEIPLPDHLYPRHMVQSGCRKPLKLPLPSDLAAGDPPRRNRPVKSLPLSLTTARDFGWEESKARGAVCKACD
jgi:hypothetical protein